MVTENARMTEVVLHRLKIVTRLWKIARQPGQPRVKSEHETCFGEKTCLGEKKGNHNKKQELI